MNTLLAVLDFTYAADTDLLTFHMSDGRTVLITREDILLVRDNKVNRIININILGNDSGLWPSVDVDRYLPPCIKELSLKKSSRRLSVPI